MMPAADTIFALSSGPAPAAIAVVRVSGGQAADALRRLAGSLPPPRRAVTRRLCDPVSGALLDRALVLWLPGPTNATGEDCVELHCHGGRAVVAAVLAALAQVPGLRAAAPGEFTRRAFANGRIDLSEAEGLADLLSAETELQRRVAMAMAEGSVSRMVEAWRQRLLALAAMVEASLDFADEDDVSNAADGGAMPALFHVELAALARDICEHLAAPRAEALREGFKVVLAGPPNAGKSTLFNALIGDDAAIVTPQAGTTRDVLQRPVAVAGVPLLFIDTAGLRDDDADAIEQIGIARARRELERADLVLWLGEEGQGPVGTTLWELAARCDDPTAPPKSAAARRVSAHSGEGLDALKSALADAARAQLPAAGQAMLNQRQAQHLTAMVAALDQAACERDPLLLAEGLRRARHALDALVGRVGTEDMLDALFGRFCIGK